MERAEIGRYAFIAVRYGCCSERNAARQRPKPVAWWLLPKDDFSKQLPEPRYRWRQRRRDGSYHDAAADEPSFHQVPKIKMMSPRPALMMVKSTQPLIVTVYAVTNAMLLRAVLLQITPAPSNGARPAPAHHVPAVICLPPAAMLRALYCHVVTPRHALLKKWSFNARSMPNTAAYSTPAYKAR